MEGKLRDLLVGAGIGDMLRMGESRDDSKLESERRLNAYGGSKASSGFIRRMLGEVKKVHNGAYKPITKLAKDSTMNSPRVFNYSKVPKPSNWLQTKFGKAKAPADSADPFGGMTTQQIKDELHTLMGRADKVGNKNTPKAFNTTEKIKAEVLRLREAKAPAPAPAMKKPDMALYGKYHSALKSGKNKPQVAQFEALYHDWLMVNDPEYKKKHKK